MGQAVFGLEHASPRLKGNVGRKAEFYEFSNLYDQHVPYPLMWARVYFDNNRRAAAPISGPPGCVSESE